MYMYMSVPSSKNIQVLDLKLESLLSLWILVVKSFEINGDTCNLELKLYTATMIISPLPWGLAWMMISDRMEDP